MQIGNVRSIVAQKFERPATADVGSGSRQTGLKPLTCDPACPDLTRAAQAPGQLRTWVLTYKFMHKNYISIIKIGDIWIYSNIIRRTTLDSVKMCNVFYVWLILMMFQIERLAAPAILAKWESVWIRSSWKRSFVNFVLEKGPIREVYWETLL